MVKYFCLVMVFIFLGVAILGEEPTSLPPIANQLRYTLLLDGFLLGDEFKGSILQPNESSCVFSHVDMAYIARLPMCRHSLTAIVYPSRSSDSPFSMIQQYNPPNPFELQHLAIQGLLLLRRDYMSRVVSNLFPRRV